MMRVRWWLVCALMGVLLAVVGLTVLGGNAQFVVFCLGVLFVVSRYFDGREGRTTIENRRCHPVLPVRRHDNARGGNCRGQTPASVRSVCELDRYLAGRRVDSGPHRRSASQGHRDGDDPSAGRAPRRSPFPGRTRGLVRRLGWLNSDASFFGDGAGITVSRATHAGSG